MNTSVQKAALLLFQQIKAPAGIVNTLVERVGTRDRIRVLVDPGYKYYLSKVPKKFMGFEVVIDVREPVYALTNCS